MKKGQRWLPFFLTALAVLPWLTALAGPFQFDDHNVIAGFAPVHSLAAWWHSMPGIRPLLKLSYAANWTLSPSPFGFHLFNLLVHLLNGTLLLAWARRVLPLRDSLCIFLVLLWLLHPVQTEAVTYIAGRSVSLSATFLLAGLLVLASDGRRSSLWAALFTLLGLAVRETAWVFPLLFVLVEYVRGKRFGEALQLALPSLLVVLVAAAFFLLEPHYRQMVETSFAARDFAAQWRAQTVGLSWLLGQLFSLNPDIDPDLRVPLQWHAALLWQCAGVVFLALAALFFTWRYRSWKAAGLLWFFLLLLPTNSLMPRLDVANDRHLYAALAGPLWTLLLLLQEWRYRHLVAGSLVLVFAAATLVRNEDYRSELALWLRAAEQSPGKARVWNNLGMACSEAGRTACAETAFRQAMALDPVDTKAAVNLNFLKNPLVKDRQ